MNKPRRSITPIIRLANQNKNIEQIPAHLKPMQFNRYPSDNAITFERWYLNSWSGADDRERIYLPIQWTALYCNNGYGNHPIKHTIQTYINSLDNSKKYYTIIQYDDGIINDIDGLDIKIFAMSGPRIDYPLPLLCTPHKFNFDPLKTKKDIFASFIGSLTHPIRAQVVDQLKDKEGYYVSTKHHDLREYCHVMARSKYALCPRGYGQSSFRIQEAIDFGAIPVYISDEFVIPYNEEFFRYGPTLSPEEDINKMLVDYYDAKRIDNVFLHDISKNKHLFTYAGCKQMILKELLNEPKNEEAENQNHNGVQ